VGLQLLEAVLEHLKKTPVQTLHALIAETSNLPSVLQKAHFSYRSKGAHVVAYAQPSTKARALLDKQPHWFFNHADVLA